MFRHKKPTLLALLFISLFLLSAFSLMQPTFSEPVDGEPDTEKTAANNMIVGFYTVYHPQDLSSFNSLSSYSSYITDIATVSFDVDKSGDLLGTSPANGLKLAQDKQVHAFACVSNHGATGSFDKDTAHAVLANTAIRQKTVAHLLDLVKKNGYAGVSVDFENMYPSDRGVYSQFIRELASALHPQGYKVIVSVTAKTSDSPNSNWAGAFDYAALGQAADYIQLMTYDENGPWGQPGPIASLPWVDKVLQYAVTQIPSEKILLGLPSYGYDWNVSTNKGHKAVTWKQMRSLRALPGAVQQWDAQAQSPYLIYQAKDRSRHIVWYENDESIFRKTQLVRQYHLAGVSVWRLGLENLSFWRAVATGLQP